MSKARRSYSKEFKLDAIALVEEQGYSVAEAARSLDINDGVLRRWIKQHREEGQRSFPGKGSQNLSPEQQRIRELEEENRKLKMEKDILKKAAAFFAKEVK